MDLIDRLRDWGRWIHSLFLPARVRISLASSVFWFASASVREIMARRARAGTAIVPHEALLLVFHSMRLSPRELTDLAQVSQQWYRAASSNLLWRSHALDLARTNGLDIRFDCGCSCPG